MILLRKKKEEKKKKKYKIDLVLDGSWPRNWHDTHSFVCKRGKVARIIVMQ